MSRIQVPPPTIIVTTAPLWVTSHYSYHVIDVSDCVHGGEGAWKEVGEGALRCVQTLAMAK